VYLTSDCCYRFDPLGDTYGVLLLQCGSALVWRHHYDEHYSHYFASIVDYSCGLVCTCSFHCSRNSRSSGVSWLGGGSLTSTSRDRVNSSSRIGSKSTTRSADAYTSPSHVMSTRTRAVVVATTTRTHSHSFERFSCATEPPSSIPDSANSPAGC